jgi:hypothetical protein
MTKNTELYQTLTENPMYHLAFLQFLQASDFDAAAASAEDL